MALHQNLPPSFPAYGSHPKYLRAREPKIKHLPAWQRPWGRLFMLGIMLLVSLVISGCVQYDVGVKVAGPHQGVLVQQIHLDEELSGFAGKQAKQWLGGIEARVRSLGGEVKRSSAQDLTVKIPFTNAQDLTDKFKRFFQPETQKLGNSEALPDLNLRFSLEQSNLLLLQRCHLRLDADLRSLGLVAADGEVIINPGSLFDLQFSLESPWGAKISIELITRSSLRSIKQDIG
ncbi:MAG: DUF3153 domain-containing protein [Coleofasciculaceae cyanobacterium SM2_1_6]|nr:DUF3153 domain-containing protein [Coleofasciculaceae cyanobacterium SM2_1_6]